VAFRAHLASLCGRQRPCVADAKKQRPIKFPVPDGAILKLSTAPSCVSTRRAR